MSGSLRPSWKLPDRPPVWRLPDRTTTTRREDETRRRNADADGFRRRAFQAFARHAGRSDGEQLYKAWRTRTAAGTREQR